MLVDDDNAVDEMIYSDPLGKSDHIVITWKYYYTDSQLNVNSAKGQTLKDFKKGNYKRISEDLEKVDWTNLEAMGVDEAWDES